MSVLQERSATVGAGVRKPLCDQGLTSFTKREQNADAELRQGLEGGCADCYSVNPIAPQALLLLVWSEPMRRISANSGTPSRKSAAMPCLHTGGRDQGAGHP